MTSASDQIAAIVTGAPAFVPPPVPPPAPTAALNEASLHSEGGGFGGGRGAGERPPGVDEPDDLDLAKLPLTDLGNAERFSRRNAGRLLYVAALGWLAWDGRRWAREGADEVVTIAVHRTVRAIQREAKALRESGDDIVVVPGTKSKPDVLLSDKIAAWGRASEAAAKLKPVSPQAAPYLAVAAGELDADPWKLNVLNGTLHIRPPSLEGDDDPVQLRPHDPADRITKLAPVLFDPAAECPVYDRFMDRVQPEAAMRRFLHQWAGYSLTGDCGEQKLCFFYGKGKNGKSTALEAWSVVAGDYGETVPIETFLDQGRGRNAGGATPDLAILPGVRMLRTSEPEKGAKLAEALIKLVTGGEPIQARHLNRDYFKYWPKFKLTMSGNYRPKIDGADEGIWRRVELVPWGVTIPKAEIDRHLSGKLAREAAGILNRLLDGLRDYLDGGMAWPETVTDATAAYRSDSDPLGRFLAAAVGSETGARVAAHAMHRTFAAWAKSAGEREWTPKGLGMALKERGFRSIHSNGTWWLDCRLVRDEADFAADGRDGGPAPPPRDEDGDG